MKKPILGLFASAAVLAGAGAAKPALAHGNFSCSVPRAEKQPAVKLQRQLKEAGWRIRKMQTFNGCYEVYARDDQGVMVEAIFDPRTLQRLDQEPVSAD